MLVFVVLLAPAGLAGRSAWIPAIGAMRFPLPCCG